MIKDDYTISLQLQLEEADTFMSATDIRSEAPEAQNISAKMAEEIAFACRRHQEELENVSLELSTGDEKKKFHLVQSSNVRYRRVSHKLWQSNYRCDVVEVRTALSTVEQQGWFVVCSFICFDAQNIDRVLQT